MTSFTTLSLAEKLIACRSVTPNDANCQQILIEYLQPLGFECETLHSADVTNLWAIRRSSLTDFQQKLPTLVFAGHTDVVPTGPIEQWHSDPFIPTQRDGKLYGRGAADMKTSIAAFLAATTEFLRAHPQPKGNIAFLITSDEEGPATDGTLRVVERLQTRGEKIDYCIVGEPTSVKTLGDMIKNGRRGSLSGRLTVYGVQGHIAYPHLAQNPIHLIAPALHALTQIVWDQGNEYFPPTTWQISNIQSGTGATNVIPGEISIDFNFRFSTASTPESLKAQVHQVLEQHQLRFDLQWTLGGNPFLTEKGLLSKALSQAIYDETNIQPELSTTGGTSDGRFIAQICSQVVEFGPPNASIHKINEHIDIQYIEPLKNIYRRTMEQLLL